MLSLNQEVWYVPPGYGLVIRCNIVEIDDYFFRQNQDSYIFYIIDEPVGHSLTEDELFLDFDEAMEYMKESNYSPCDLQEYRKQKCDFIASTWKLDSVGGNVELLNSYTNKIQNLDWFK